MKKLVIAAGIALAASLVHAQTAPPSPAGLVVASGNFYSPIVANLEEAVRFYRDGIGFEFQGEPGNADSNPQLRAMFGLPDARLRWHIGRAPGIPGGVEIVEILSASGQPLGRRIQETSAVMLMVVVRDIDVTLARLKALGAPVVTRGGSPVLLSPLEVRAVVVQDPAGHFVELLQPRNPPATQLGTGDIRNVRLRHVVADLDRAVALYGDALGIKVESRVPRSGYTSAPRVVDLLGVPRNTNWRYTTLNVPASHLPIELIEFKDSQRLFPNVTVMDMPATGGADQLAEFKTPDIASPGATRIQLFVTDIDAAVAAFAEAGGTFVSTGGKPLDVPAANGTFKVGAVRDPDGLFVVLIDSPQ
jgi:catechol 2,3-dioxygenase-like lactoylglutathione lyase family enzyme